MGKKAHIWRLPKGLMNGIAKLGGWLHLPLNPLRMQKLTENYVVSNAKIKAALGIEQIPVRAKDGLLFTSLIVSTGMVVTLLVLPQEQHTRAKTMTITLMMTFFLDERTVCGFRR